MPHAHREIPRERHHADDEEASPDPQLAPKKEREAFRDDEIKERRDAGEREAREALRHEAERAKKIERREQQPAPRLFTRDQAERKKEEDEMEQALKNRLCEIDRTDPHRDARAHHAMLGVPRHVGVAGRAKEEAIWRQPKRPLSPKLKVQPNQIEGLREHDQ